MKSTLFIVVLTLILSPISFGKVIVIFDENDASEASGGAFAEGFVSHDAGSVVEVTSADAFSGAVSVSCTPSQSYNNSMPNWSFPIDETPYITFAWKKDGGTGIMIQFAFNNTWAYRYYSGVNVTNWPGIQLEKDIPTEWKSYTRNMVDDFGGGWKLTGLALTPWNGTAGYYDYIILHTEEDELATAVSPADKVALTWAEIK